MVTACDSVIPQIPWNELAALRDDGGPPRRGRCRSLQRRGIQGRRARNFQSLAEAGDHDRRGIDLFLWRLADRLQVGALGSTPSLLDSADFVGCGSGRRPGNPLVQELAADSRV